EYHLYPLAYGLSLASCVVNNLTVAYSTYVSIEKLELYQLIAGEGRVVGLMRMVMEYYDHIRS
ncbi:hypothetical protein Dimus_030863, partial [Dionaea muscipula]